MKTHIIHLELHDDVTSVRDKISWAKTERILLVFPRSARILRRRLDLRLLLRHANSLGGQLAIVTNSIELRQTAQELHIRLFSSVASAQRRTWDEEPLSTVAERPAPPDFRQMRKEISPPEAAWRSHFRPRIILFSMAVLAILAVLSLFIPSATIELLPGHQVQRLSFIIRASQNVTAINLAGSIPARMSSVVVENNMTIQATGSVKIPDGWAQGLASFRNLITEQVVIPVGTVISTNTNPPVRFSTTEAAVVEAGVGKTMVIPVQAVEAGSTGNLPADSLVAFEDAGLGTSLAVINPNPTTGGTDRSAAIQTSTDRLRVHETLLADLLEECTTDLENSLGNSDITFPDTLAVSQVLSETYFPAEGQSSDTLSLAMRLKCQVQYASREDVEALAEMTLDANLPDGFSPTSGGVTILLKDVPVTEADGTTHWNVEAQQVLQARLEPLTAVQLSLGHTAKLAIRLLQESLPLAEVPVIHVQPGWWPWLPVIPFRIEILMSN
jgi:hypothetical protein